MIGRYPIRCPACSHIVAYVSEIAAKHAVQSVSLGFLGLDAVAAKMTDAAALRCTNCESIAMTAAAVSEANALAKGGR